MKNSLDFRKIDEGKLGAINFNNMIPVPNKAIIPISIEEIEDFKYRRLLQNQYNAISKEWNTIIKIAKELRILLLKNDKQLKPFELKIKNRCCNLKILETKFQDYKI